MSRAEPDIAYKPKWEQVADHLDQTLHGPSREQQRIATTLGFDLPPAMPVPVAAVVIRSHVAKATLETLRPTESIPDTLAALEKSLGLVPTRELATWTVEEVRAWLQARYTLKTSRGLRHLRPEPGDVVVDLAGTGTTHIVSSVSVGGRVYYKGTNAGSAWPSNLNIVSRSTDDDHETATKKAEAARLNAEKIAPVDPSRFDRFAPFALTSTVPTYEAIRELEDLLEAGEVREERYQELIARNPELLSGLVMGGWQTFVIPKARFGSEHVSDFLVLGINSVGPQWMLVELESPSHRITVKDGSPAKQTRHAIQQINDWRDWVLENVAYARNQLGYHGLTSRAAGLVIIGQADKTTEPQRGRSRVTEDSRIEVHSWNWLLREARRRSSDTLYVSSLASDDLRDQARGTQFQGTSFTTTQGFEPLRDAVIDLDELFD